MYETVILIALFLDSVSLLYPAVKDFKEFELDTYLLPLFSIAPLIISVLTHSIYVIALMLIFLFVSFLLMSENYIGYGDILVYLRLGLIVGISEFISWKALIILFVALVITSIAYYYIKTKPMLCKGYKLFRKYQMVKKEYIAMPSILPANIKIETDDEAVNKIKKQLMTQNAPCIEAYVGMPLIFLFGVAYLITATTLLALSLLI